MRLWRRHRAKLATPSGEIETPMRNGALVALVSYDVWEVLSIHDRNVLLRVDDCMAGRYDVAELRRRLYPVDRERIYDDFHLTADERVLANDVPDETLRTWADAAESRENLVDWLRATVLCVCGHRRGVHGMPGIPESFIPKPNPSGSMLQSPPCMAAVDGDRCPCVRFEAA